MRNDLDPAETSEWRDAFDSVIEFDGADRAEFLLEELSRRGPPQRGAPVPYSANTPYLNTIPPDAQPPHPGDREIEHRIRSLIRWNAVAIVLRANKESSELGGHIASFQSAATLYDTGFQPLLARARRGSRRRPGVRAGPLLARYLRALVPGGPADRGAAARVPAGGRRRRPVVLSAPVADAGLLAVPDGVDGAGPADGDLPGPVPQVPAQPRARRHRDRHVWAFLGDGEMDEPESLGAISLAGREKLDNLIFVVNCNLQRLDGPVRGNGKIIQELEGVFRGAGWNVIKVIWGPAGTR